MKPYERVLDMLLIAGLLVAMMVGCTVTDAARFHQGPFISVTVNK